MADQPTVSIHTDGACLGNPGPGGWGAILTMGANEKELSGGHAPTTNNRMEILAVIKALEALTKPCTVDITTDSQYVKKAFTEGWLAKWKKNGWQTAARKPVKNQDLWRHLDQLLSQHQVRFHWVRGHAGHPENERADALASAAARQRGLSRDPGYPEK